MKFLKTTPLCLVLAAVLCFSGCGNRLSATTEPPTTLPPETTVPPTTMETEPPETTNPLDLVEDVTVVVTQLDIDQLEDYPNLKKADLTGSTCYDAILSYMEAHPEVEVLYTVTMGDLTIPNTQTELTLEPDSFEYTALLENLPYLPQLTTLTLPHTSLTAEELNAIREVRPDMALDYTVDLLGTEYSLDTAELDLSFLTAAQAEEAAPILAKLTNLEYVELMTSGNRSNLSMEDVKLLVDAAPHINFHYSFYLFGKSVSTTDEKVEYTNVNIGNSGEAQLRAALDIMTGCTYFKLENCKIDNEILAQLREDYRDAGIKIVWRIYFGQYGKYSVLTDTELIRAVYNVFDDSCHDLRYCEDAKYIDMGHNGTLTDLSFIGYMPNLEILIASGCAVTDLSGFENCKKLEWLELAGCTYLKDLSPLEGCESLRFLNISGTAVTDLMPLDGLPLERFVCLNPKVPPAEQEIFMSIHGDCWTRFLGSQPYGIGWRYDDNGKTYSEYYLKIREIFGYDNMPLEYD